MVCDPPRPRGNLIAAPLLITAELPPDVQAWADALRRAHYPPERNRLAAHVTLFHALPPSVEGEVRALLGDLAQRPAPDAEMMDLGKGTAFLVLSPAMLGLHEEIAERMHGVLSQQDAHRPKLHITVQNKVEKPAAKALQAELAEAFQPRSFRFHALGLYAWEDGLWRAIRTYPFRG